MEPGQTPRAPGSALGWARRGGLAVVDQGVFAGSHFVMNVALARWLDPSDYGTFTVAYALFLLTAAVHAGMLVEPVLVHGSSRYRSELSSYLSVALFAHWRLTIALGGGLAIIGCATAATGGPDLGLAIIAAGVLSPQILLLWLMRRVVYVTGEVWIAVVGGAAYALLLLGGLLLLRSSGHLSPFTALVDMGLSASLASAGIWRLRVRAGHTIPRASVSARSDSFAFGAIRAGVQYGRWAAGAQILSWLSINGFYVLVGTFGSVRSAGTLKAIMNLMLPIQHVIIGVAAALLPEMAKKYRSSGVRGVLREAGTVAALLGPAAVLYAILIGFGGTALLDFVYEGRYTSQASWVFLVLPLPVLWTSMALLENALRAVGRPRAVFASFAVSGAFLVVTTVPLIALVGVAAALVLWSVALLLGSVLMSRFMIQGLREADSATYDPAQASKL